jgi:two-component system, NtrC family, response regulator GlrR
MTSPTLSVRGQTLVIRQFEVTVLEGVDCGMRVVSQSEELSIGSNEGNDLQLRDPAVSRHHCTLRAEERGLALLDLGSRNGTFLNEVEIKLCYIAAGAQLRVGQSVLSVRILDQDLEQPLASGDRAGAILGASFAMRRLYPLLELCGKSAANVLINGETGTGKELVAEAIHEASERRAGPFVVVDCSALSHDLAGSELFGHERGAFTGADATRLGAFESAHGGTVFLDEVGELPLSLQPLLLRAIENRTIRRIGGHGQHAVDVRVIAATHRDLRVEVNEKRFRADLFYRLNVLRVTVPPLRERDGDVELLAAHFWRMFRPDQPPPGPWLRHLAMQPWPGNVRELRNAVERAACVGWISAPRPPEPVAADASLTYQDAKERAIWAWERGWIEELIKAAGGNLSRAARAARMGRTHVRELARRHGIPVRGQPADPAGDDAE